MNAALTAARERIDQVDLADWRGLPVGCHPGDLFPELSDDTSGWAVRPLGDEFEHAAFAVLDMPGYYRPTVSVRDGVVVLFDGTNPQIVGGLASIVSSAGRPAASLDYRHGTLPVSGGEWVYASRGLTVFVNTTADTALHVALYAPTSPDEYVRHLRPHLGKTLRPRPIVE